MHMAVWVWLADAHGCVGVAGWMSLLGEQAKPDVETSKNHPGYYRQVLGRFASPYM